MRRTLIHSEPATVADLAVAAGLAMAAGDKLALASLRVVLARRIDSGIPASSSDRSSVAALAEVLVAFEDARRVAVERDRQARTHRPLRENILIELVKRGPSTPAELAAALHDDDDRVRYAIRRLARDGLVQPVTTARGRARRYELSRTGVAATMAG